MKYKLSDIAFYVKEKISVDTLTVKNYISTENMKPNKGGIVDALSLPTTTQAQRYETGDILVSNIRPYFKKIWFAERTGGCSNDVLVIRPKEGVDARFLYYVMSNDIFFDYSMSTSKGTKMPRGDKTAIMNYQVQLYDIETQRKIANFLGEIDAKIELNNRINNNLEQQIQTLFSRDFGQYSFATNSAEESKLPSSWKYYRLSELCKQIRPGTNFQPKRVESGIPFLNVRCINQGYIDISDAKYISDSEYKHVHKTWQPEENDILISRIGTLGLVAVIRKEDLPIAVHYNFIDIKVEKVPFEFMYFLLKSEMFQSAYHFVKKQSVQEYVTIDEVEDIRIPLPVIADYDFDVYKNYYAMILDNQRETRQLIMLRDALLPKLMAGELDVSDIQL